MHAPPETDSTRTAPLPAAAHRLFVAAIRQSAGARATIPPDIDAETLDLTIAHAVRSRMLAQLSAGIGSTLDPGLRDRLDAIAQRSHFETMRLNALLLERSGDIARTLGAEGIPFVFFKGLFQQYQIYGDFFRRPCADIDVLVTRRDFRRAMAVLSGTGFRAPADRSLWWETFLGERHLVDRQGAGRSLDLHNRLQQPGTPGPKDPAAFLRHDTAIDHRGQRFPVVPPSLLPLVPAMNLVKGLAAEGRVMTHAWDLAQLLDRGDTARVADFLAAADRQGLTGTAMIALRVLRALFPDQYADMDARCAGILPEIGDAELVAIVTETSPADRVLRRRHILIDACARNPLRILGQGAWFGASELSRRIDREHLRGARS